MPLDSLTTPESLSLFIGQERVKARLELAIAAAKSRGEPLGHILLLGSPGLGKSTLAGIIAKTLSVAIKSTSGATIANAGDLVGLLTGLLECYEAALPPRPPCASEGPAASRALHLSKTLNRTGGPQFWSGLLFRDPPPAPET